MSELTLPEGWLSIDFMDVLDVQGGTQPPKSTFIYEESEGYIRLLQIRDFGDKPVPTYVPDTKKLRTCEEDDVLIARYGASLGRICTGMKGAYNVALAKVVVPEHIKKNYLKYFLKSGHFQDPLNLLSRSAQNGFNKKDLESFPLVVPSQPEQEAIVKYLDNYLTTVSQIQARLNAIPKLIEKFRQSILNDAVSGKLTGEWRDRQESFESIEPFTTTSEERLDIYGAKYKKPIKLKNKPEYKIPNSWQWTSIDSSCVKITDGTHHSPESFSEGSYRYITSKNVRNGYMDLTKITYVDETTHKEIYSRCDVKFHDVLLVKDGANTGLCCVNNLNEEFSLLSSVGVLKPSSFLNPFYLQFYFWSPMAKNSIESVMGGTAIKRLTLTKIMNLPLSLPPIKEQKEIVSQIERFFAYADQIEKSVATAKARVDNLTQSILYQAFTGQLTAEWREQNPDLISGENSAEVLLAKIKAEKQYSGKKLGKA